MAESSAYEKFTEFIFGIIKSWLRVMVFLKAKLKFQWKWFEIKIMSH